MTKEEIRIEVLAQPRLLSSVRGLVRCYLAECGFSTDRTEEVVLAVNEACANSIRHAYGSCPTEKLELKLRSDADSVEIVLLDEGRPAPAECVAPREPTFPDPAALEPGGLGVPIIYKVFDKVEFRPGRKRGNRVTMRLKRPRGKAGP